MGGREIACVALTVFAVGCTDANLYGKRARTTADKIALKGHLCTSDPTERAFPVRVLFLIDTSINDRDYIALRGDSIERLARTFGGPNYSYAILRYAGLLKGTTCGLRNLTPDGFTRDLEEPIAGVRCADLSNPGRSLIDAMSLAQSFMTGDVLTLSKGVRSRTKYVVVLLANGPPTVDLSAMWCAAQNPPIATAQCDGAYRSAFCKDVRPPPVDCETYQYTRIVREMGDFVRTSGAQEFYFHIVYQRDPDFAGRGQDDPNAIGLFSDLALAGAGTLFRFPGPATCNVNAGDGAGCLFSLVNVDSTQAVFQRRQLIVANRSALATSVGILPDTDQDGIADEVEDKLLTSAVARDSDGDALSDRIEHLLKATGLDPLNHQDTINAWPVECPRPGSPNPKAFSPDQDLDGDRLSDCEELLLKSDPTLFDSDADGIADPLEFRVGTNLLANDTAADPDNDGRINMDEHRFHLDPLSMDPNTDGAYAYAFDNEAKTNVLSFTQPYEVTGVTIVQVSNQTTEGRGTIYYEPPPNIAEPISETNAATLSWRDPQDDTPSGADPGRGPRVAVTKDGTYTLQSARAVVAGGEDRSIVVDVWMDLLRFDPVRADVRLRQTQRTCFDFRVENISLVPTRVLPDVGEAGMNYIDVMLSEVPENNPRTYGVIRVATLPMKYPENPQERVVRDDIELIDEDFLLFGE